MTRNFTVLDDLHEMFTAAGIEHRYTIVDLVITVIRGDHAWTVSEDCIIYWGSSPDVCKYRGHVTTWAADAYDYIADVTRPWPMPTPHVYSKGAVSVSSSAPKPVSFAATMRGITGVDRGKATGNLGLLQDVLIAKRFLTPGARTGVWDAATRAAYDAFLRAKGFSRGDDGRPLWQGWSALMREGGWSPVL